MSSADVLSLVAIGVALLSLGVTTYQQFLKPAKLEVDLGSVIFIAYNDDARDSINAQLAISLINTGARAAIATKMLGVIERRNGDWRTSLTWHSFYRPVDAGLPGTAVQPWFSFIGYAGPLVAASRDANTTDVLFLSEPISTPVPAGEYLLTITSWARPAGRGPMAVSAIFTITESEAVELHDDAIAPVHLTFELQPIAGA
jgi:hypothetical protein